VPPSEDTATDQARAFRDEYVHTQSCLAVPLESPLFPRLHSSTGCSAPLLSVILCSVATPFALPGRAQGVCVCIMCHRSVQCFQCFPCCVPWCHTAVVQEGAAIRPPAQAAQRGAVPALCTLPARRGRGCAQGDVRTQAPDDDQQGPPKATREAEAQEVNGT
jgi:hypothetical protein